MADSLLHIINARASLWSRLRESTVAATTRRGRPVAFHLEESRAEQAKHLAEAGVSADDLESLCESLEKSPPTSPCVIDIVQAALLMREQKLEAGDALRRSRVRYQGTDGVRGKARADLEDVPPLAALVEEGAFTPGLCDLLAMATAQWFEAESVRVVLADDGRTGGKDMARAASLGFTRDGHQVINLGVAPTPLVPAAMAMLGAQLGAALTASHNPADQNGIKFFHRGRKPLPQPDDFAVSALAFLLQIDRSREPRGPGKIEQHDPRALMLRVLDATLKVEDVEALKSVHLVVDVAHGAFAPFGVFRQLGLHAEVINADMTGDNINRDSGVAYLEGRDHLRADDIAHDILFVRRVYERGRTADRRVIGIAFDGDGDRAMLALYDATSDEVRLIDGDRMAFLIAKLATENEEWEGRAFAGTVESDLAVFDAVERLGIETVMTPVGDKWLSSRPALAEKLLVGEEASGHVVWPVTVNGKTVVTGNGMLSGLRAAAAIVRLGLSVAAAAEPFRPGVVKTFYTYFVERPRFYRGGPIWIEDLRIANETLSALMKSGEFPEDVELSEVVFEDDEDMLYLQVRERGRAIGAIFARNSGTENKIATYARGLKRLERGLIRLAHSVNVHHIETLKDERLVEARASKALIAALEEAGQLSLDGVREVLEEHGLTGDVALSAMLYAFTKEGIARRAGDVLKKIP